MTPTEMAALHALCFANPAPWPAPEFVSLLAHPLVFALTEPEAFLIGRTVAGEAELLTLAVAPQSRRRGLGLRLVQRFVYQARLRGAEVAFLEVAAPNSAARALYARAGFSDAGLRRGYYTAIRGMPLDAVVMRRMLAPMGATEAG